MDHSGVDDRQTDGVLTPAAPRALDLTDLFGLAQALRLKDQPADIFRAVAAVAAQTLGFRLFTIMCFDAERFEVERVFSNMPEVYPLSGRKKKRGSAWGEHTLRNITPFRATSAQGIRDAFDDSEVLIGLGLGSILNIPVAYAGRCVGTMNLTHVEGWYTAEHEAMGVLLGAFLATPLALRQLGGLGENRSTDSAQ
jgi:GAF domain-containing protein